MNLVDTQLHLVFDWCNANKLTINHLKTNYILFRSYKRSISVHGALHINNKVINEVESASFVGILIDRHLNWSKHIQMINSTIRKKVGILFKLRQFIPTNILILLYKTLIQPHISYGLEVWGSTYPSYLQTIFLSQKMAVRAITFSNFQTHTAHLFKQLYILDIYKLYKLHVCSFIYNLINNNLPHSLLVYCQFPVHSYSTRHKNKGNLFVPSVNTSMGKFAISYAGPLLWNSLPDHIKAKPTLNSFRHSLKTWLLQN